MEEQKGKKELIHSVFSTKEEFVVEVEKIFSSLKDSPPFSLGVDMGRHWRPIQVDVEWRITTSDSDRHRWSLSEVEFVLSVVVSRQTPNVKEIRINVVAERFGDISAEVWKLLSKLNNLTHLNLGLK